MWQIRFQKLLTFFSNEARLFSVIALVFFITGCTINFKAKELDLETKPLEGKIGLTEHANTTYRLAAIGILDDVGH